MKQTFRLVLFFEQSNMTAYVGDLGEVISLPHESSALNANLVAASASLAFSSRNCRRTCSSAHRPYLSTNALKTDKRTCDDQGEFFTRLQGLKRDDY